MIDILHSFFKNDYIVVCMVIKLPVLTIALFSSSRRSFFRCKEADTLKYTFKSSINRQKGLDKTSIFTNPGPLSGAWHGSLMNVDTAWTKNSGIVDFRIAMLLIGKHIRG